LNNSALVFKILDNYFIGFFNVNSLVCWAFLGEFTVFFEWDRRVVWMDDSLCYTDLVIFLTESWRTMDDTST
jgi:hypothetical protein